MGRVAYVNGRFVPHAEAFVHVEDRGYQLADAVYEVWAVLGGRLDVGVMVASGIAGYFLRKLDFPIAPIALTLVLGPQFEMSLRQSLVLSDGSYMIFFRSGISTTLVALAAAIIVFASAGPAIGLFRKPHKTEESEV